MKLFLCSLIFTASIVGCSHVQSVTCPIFESQNAALVSAIAAAGSCAGTAAILVSLQSAEVTIKVCPALSALAKGGIVSDLCTALVPVAAGALGTTLPTAWQCNLSGSSVTTLLQAACGLIPVKPVSDIKKK